MNEPTRLIEAGNDDFERDLLRSAHGDQPSDRAFRRTLVSIGVGLIVTPTAVASAVPATALGTKLGAVVLAKWLFTGVALGVVTAGGVGLSERAFEQAPSVKAHAPAKTGTAPVSSEAKAPLAEPARGEPAAESTPESDVSELSPALPEQAARLRRASSPAVEAPSPSPVVAPEPAASAAVAPSGVSERLAHETRLLDTARGALLRGDATSAIVTLTEYERSFAHGMLAPEARVLRVRALLANGERAAAEALAARIVEAAPDGEHADAVRAVLGRASNR